MELFEIVWWVGAICMASIIVLNFPLISRLKKISSNEFQKAGRPNPLWSDIRSFKFIAYILSRKYRNLTDSGLVSMFGIARVLWMVFLTCFAAFFLIIAIMEYWQ